jgi:hypothetical protein
MKTLSKKIVMQDKEWKTETKKFRHTNRRKHSVLKIKIKQRRKMRIK